MELDLNCEMLGLLPPLYREIEDYQQICQTEESQFRQAADSIRTVYQNFFVQTADEDSVQRWEQLLRIRAKPSAETLEFRRMRILSRLRTRPPFTLAFLYQQLNDLLGTGSWTCEVDYPAYTLTIGADAESTLHKNELLHLVNQIKPAHIAFRKFFFHTAGKALFAAAAPCGTSILASVRMPEIKKEDTQ